MMVGAMPVGLSYPGAASVAGLVQLEGVKAAWKTFSKFLPFLQLFFRALLNFIAFFFSLPQK